MNKVCLACEFEHRTQNQDPCSACIEFEQFIPKDSQPVKTLLDEFAMAAMAAIVGKRPYMTVSNGDSDALETALMIVRSDVNGAYTIAAAMMSERARRDEMGNVKEVK